MLVGVLRLNILQQIFIMNNEILTVKNLKTYFLVNKYKSNPTYVRAVDGVSFSIKEGEIMGLVGESGGGKSMVGLSILRLVPEGGKIASGEIIFEGKNLLNLPDIGCDNSVESVLFSIYGSFDWVFEVGTWDNYKYGRPVNTLGHVTAGDWYWVHMNNTQARFYLDVNPPIVIIDDPEDGSIFAYDNESWITDVYVEIYDQNDSLYYNGSGWQSGQIWLPCNYTSGNEWTYDTDGIWTDDHIYTLIAMAYDASGCTGVDSSTFTIQPEE